ncbi:hypothetical protein [Halopelagius longus]|uniref:TRAM domain-containing protein n=1 Tax=Halopelagius longus TaxID=1236180 RepID=A0A1H0Z9J3_9EURY|nr:hypothetical protein [Halopelagius longus]SDQ23821.1 hypothetical protein SAMN05216278_1082 [Halopelagius longus]
MVALSPGDELEVTIDRESKSGNCIAEPEGTTKHVNLGEVDYREDDVVKVRITDKKHGNYYADVIKTVSRTRKLEKEQSVGKTRSMSSATETVHDRDFDPRTHGAPEISRSEPKDYECREDDEEDQPKKRSSKPDMDSLATIAENCEDSFTETQEKQARVVIRKRRWGMQAPFDVSKKP